MKLMPITTKLTSIIIVNHTEIDNPNCIFQERECSVQPCPMWGRSKNEIMGKRPMDDGGTIHTNITLHRKRHARGHLT